MSLALQGLLEETEEAKSFSEIYDAEGISSIVDFFESVSVTMAETFDWLANNHKSATINTPIPLANHLSELEEIGYTSLMDTHVYLPPYCKTDMFTYIGLLFKQISMIADIEQRLYVPIEEHFSRSVHLENFHNKPWSDRRMEFSDIKRMRKEFSRVNVMDGKEEDMKVVSETVKFKDTYRSIKALSEVEKMMFRVSEELSSVNLDSIKKREVEIMTHVGRLLEEIEHGEKDELTKGAKKQMVEALSSLAIETEYMTALLFNANVTINAWNMTVVKLKEFEK